MASRIDSPPGSNTPAQQNRHFETIKRKIPQWLVNASPELRRATRQAGSTQLSWFDQARQSMPDVVKALRQDHESHRFIEQSLRPALAALPPLEAFAEPLLVAAIKERFGLDVDVRKTLLFHARRAHVDQSFAAASRDPLVEVQKSLKAATQPLLSAALQNFESWESEAGGMDLDSRRKAVIYVDASASGGMAAETPLAIAPEAFAALCRELDLGGQYQKMIAAFLNPPSRPDDAPDAASFTRQGSLKRVEQSAFRIQAHLAYMQQRISEDLYNVLLEAARNGSSPQVSGRAVSCQFLRLWGVELTGIVVIGMARDSAQQVERVAVYIPGDPVCPLMEYASTTAFTHALRDRMLQKGYLAFFQSLVPARHRARLFAKLDECLRPKVWNTDMGWYEQRFDENVKLHLRESSLSGGLLTAITRQKANVLKDDALFHAVPTAEEDQKTFAERVQYFESLTLQALNVVGFVVPAVGAVMMAVAAAQLGVEVFEGAESWTRGEWAQGWGYLMDVAENVALMAALGAAHAVGTPAVETIPVEAPSFIEELDEVELRDGGSRLWKPDLGPFAHDTVLPASLKPDEFGLYRYQGKSWLAIENKVYSVIQTSPDAPFRIEHPTNVSSYQPVLRNNGAGAWLHPADRPREWEGLKLFRRLGHDVAEFSDTVAQRILWVSDTREAVLRRTLAESERPPALLEDTIQRFALDQTIQREAQGSTSAAENAVTFQTRYQGMLRSREPHAVTITHRYPDLPATVADELVRGASPSEVEALGQRRVPLRIAEEVRVYQQQIRLARAYEGIYLESVSSPDTAVLILHTMETLPGWSARLRLELRQNGFASALIDAVGPADAEIRKVLVMRSDGFQPYDAQGLELHGRDNLYSTILHALPDAERAALGFPGTWDGPKLKVAIQGAAPLPRQTLRSLLKMQPSKPGAKSPMRLADGRLAYPLSGAGALQGFIARDTLLDLIGAIGMLHVEATAEQMLAALEHSGMTRQQIHARLIQVLEERNIMDRHMNAWGDASAAIPDLESRLASRAAIHDAIWCHWAENTLPEVFPRGSALRLEHVVLGDFPTTLPDFFFQRVTRLELMDVAIDRRGAGAQRFFVDRTAQRAELEQFIAQFPRVNELDMDRSDSTILLAEPLVYQLPDLVARRLPALRNLRLANQGISIGTLEVASFRVLEQLESLDLSGNWISVLPPSNLLSLSVRQLNLDNIGLDHWPAWLEGLSSSSITELSLRNNRIVEVPWDVLDNQTPATQPTAISLHGNPLSRLTLMRIRLNEQPASRFRFNLDMPAHLSAYLALLRSERTQLREAVAQWAETSGSARPMSEATIAARRAIGQTILEFWRLYSEGQTFVVLTLERVALDDFPPRLPAFFYTCVRHLHLIEVRAQAAQLNRFLASFPQLTGLELIGQPQPHYELSSVLQNLPRVASLSLRNQGRLIDQHAIAALGRLPRLDTLDLSGNRLGIISDVSSLRPHLLWLSMENMGLDQWPAWVDDLLPLEGLVLDDNQLTDLPEYILENPRNYRAQTEIGLRRNPLSHETMRRAYLSERHNGSYSFVMELPDDIVQLAPEHPDSDSDIDDYLSDSVVTVESPATPAQVDDWLLGSVDENAAHKALWQRLEARNDANNLMALIGRLTQSAPYRSEQTRVGFSERVWHVLDAADQNETSRQLYNGIAEGALVQADTGSQTCHDGAWLVFNQIEIQMFIDQSLTDVPPESRGQSLYRLTRRLYRLHELDAIAREQAQGRDEAEVRLAYRLRWSTELDLPLPPSGMLYQVHASIRPSELETALARVQKGEHGEPFMNYAAHRDFWIEYLREVHAERFTAIKQDYLARVTALPDRFPDKTIEELGDRFAALKQEFEAQELNLIRELTYRESFDQA
ncbi:dermonecrotic toxin domain-containing protein [Pseudomonas sp. NPDC088444]|uniref:dermonecrotic toxin domain-containing protein n=1 Tax=Pseudomonas sp. NPDC088444 TaxID=3364456 RepID=UPI00384CEAE7